MKSSNLHIKYISLPKDFLFRKQTTKLLDQIHRESLSVLNSSKRINKDRVYSCEIIIQGLYECYKCLTPKASLSIPLHQSAYSRLDITKITTQLAWKPTVSFEIGVAKMVANIHAWNDAPLWDPDSIAQATQTWFNYLGHKEYA